jgi:hypothetical protein
MAVLDGSALWDPVSLDVITRDFPSRRLSDADLYLVLVECVANAALHGNAEALGFYARQREDILLLSFFQSPPMAEMVEAMLHLARRRGLPDYTCDLPGGLGFPILLRLASKVTINSNRTKLHLWFRFKREKRLMAIFTNRKKSSLAKK